MNPKSPTALIIALIVSLLLLGTPYIHLGSLAKILLLLAFLGAAWITWQRRSKT